MKFWSNNRSWDPTTDPWILNSASNNRCWFQQQTMEFKILHPTTDAGIHQQILGYHNRSFSYEILIQRQILGSNNRSLNLKCCINNSCWDPTTDPSTSWRGRLVPRSLEYRGLRTGRLEYWVLHNTRFFSQKIEKITEK